MHWRLGEGIAAGSLAVFIALVPYRSAADHAVLGRWSVPFVVLLGIVLLVFLFAVWTLRRPPLGPIDRPHRPPGAEAMDRGIDLGIAIWGCGYLVGTLFDPASRARLLTFDLLMSGVPAASLMEWGGALVVVCGILIRLWGAAGKRFPVQTVIAIVVALLLTLGEGWARWAAAYRPRPTGITTEASTRWEREHVTLNASLFRDGEHAPFAAPKTSRLVVAGGADAFGVGIDDPHLRLGEQVAVRLEPLTSRLWEPINAGVLLGRTPDELEAVRQVLGLGPEIVLLQYAFDDIEYLAPVAHPKAPGEGARGWQERLDPVAFLYTNSILFQELYLLAPGFTDRFVQRRAPTVDPYRDPALLEAHLGDLARFVASAVDSNVIVIIVPVDVEAASDTLRLARYRAFVTSADSAGLPVWGVERAFEGHTTDQLIIDPHFRHPNPFAIGLVADAVVDRLKDRVEVARGREGRGVP